jgi:hypothetical protein
MLTPAVMLDDEQRARKNQLMRRENEFGPGDRNTSGLDRTAAPVHMQSIRDAA